MEAKLATPEEVLALGKANVESALALADLAFVAVERLTALNLNTGRAALESAGSNAKALFAVKDAESLSALQSTAVKPSLEKLVAYSSSVYEIVSQTKDELSKMAEARGSVFADGVKSALEQLAKSAPAGSAPAVDALKQAMAAGDAAYANLSKAVKQFSDTAEANISAAGKAALDAVGSVPVAPKGGKKSA
ncbi:MAG: phasin family protein [Rhodocyclaceae bacterium]|nr:phasin family protein [Rhodocyclaceae bacterium]MBX3667149.1 phasin family protein [Rhodocyclaceae bacterium]